MKADKNIKNLVIGQDKIVGEIERIFKIFKNSQCKIRPHFILTGESGNSKSHTIKALAELFEMSLITLNAAQLTKEGTSGNSLSKALAPIARTQGKPCIVFVDEFDKLFISGNSNDSSAHESTTGVQNEFLTVLENDTASVFGDYGKYNEIPIGNTLFVFAGAFNGEKDITLDRLREIGLKTEFLGRVGLVFNTERLSLENLYEILEKSEILSLYLSLFKEVDRESTILKLKAYLQKNYENNTLGARMITTIVHQFFIKGGLRCGTAL